MDYGTDFKGATMAEASMDALAAVHAQLTKLYERLRIGRRLVLGRGARGVARLRLHGEVLGDGRARARRPHARGRSDVVGDRRRGHARRRAVCAADVPAGMHPDWNPAQVYQEGALVVVDGVPFEAKWWTQGDDATAGITDHHKSPWQVVDDAPTG